MSTPDKLHHFLFYICPLVRLPDFVLGMILYNVYKSVFDKKLIPLTREIATVFEVISLIVLTLSILCSSFVPQVYRYGIYYWLPMSFIIGTFAYFNTCKGVISYILSQPLLVKLGMVSFCFYMIHVLCINGAHRVISYFDSDISWQICFIATLVITSILSLLCFQYFESPINKYLRRKLD